MALFGLAAAAVPALLHLLQRRIPPTVTFPAIQYLQETERRHSRRLKLRNLLLLLLRTALIATVVLAAARPVAPLPVGDGHGPTAIALVVDNSLSSGAVAEGRPLVDDLAERARDVVSRVNSGDRLWLLLADGVPRRVSRPQALLLLDSLEAQPQRLDLGEAIRAAGRTVAEDPLPGEVVVVSDLQASALTSGAPVPVRTVVLAPPSAPANRGIDGVDVTPRVWSSSGAVVVAVGGDGDAPGEVRLEFDERPAGRDLAAPGQRVALAVRSARPGWHRARVEVGPDELRADDAWHFAVRSAPPAPAVATPDAGRFVVEALAVLQQANRVGRGSVVTLDDGVNAGRSVVFPPGETALVGALNRALAARGSVWRFGELVSGEWRIASDLAGAEGTSVFRRYRLEGQGEVLATAGGEPWVVRDGNLVLVASRLEEEWTELPVRAGFVPMLDDVINRVLAAPSWRVGAWPGQPVPAPPGVTGLLLGPGERIDASPDGQLGTPVMPGAYFLVDETGDTVGVLEVNHDPRESRFTPADAATLTAALGERVILTPPERAAAQLFREARRADLSGYLLLLALLMGLVELAAASAGGRVARET